MPLITYRFIEVLNGGNNNNDNNNIVKSWRLVYGVSVGSIGPLGCARRYTYSQQWRCHHSTVSCCIHVQHSVAWQCRRVIGKSLVSRWDLVVTLVATLNRYNTHRPFAKTNLSPRPRFAATSAAAEQALPLSRSQLSKRQAILDATNTH